MQLVAQNIQEVQIEDIMDRAKERGVRSAKTGISNAPGLGTFPIIKRNHLECY